MIPDLLLQASSNSCCRRNRCFWHRTPSSGDERVFDVESTSDTVSRSSTTWEYAALSRRCVWLKWTSMLESEDTLLSGLLDRPLAVGRRPERMAPFESLLHCCRTGRVVNGKFFILFLGCEAIGDTRWHRNWIEAEVWFGFEESDGKEEDLFERWAEVSFCFWPFVSLTTLVWDDCVLFEQIITISYKTVADSEGFVCTKRLSL